MAEKGAVKEQALPGLLLTRHWRDTARGCELEFWFATTQGPVCATVAGERAVFFLAGESFQRAGELLRDIPAMEFRELALRDFRMRPVMGVYCNSWRRLRDGARLLREAGLEPLEADINPADRFLMERYVAVSGRLQGKITRRRGYSHCSLSGLAPVDFRVALKVVSLDIETAMTGLQLYSIAVHATVDGEPVCSRVFMAGDGVSRDGLEYCATQRDLMAAFLGWLRDFDPDVLIGWNVVHFDLWYLQRVADSLGLRLALGRADAAPRWRELDEDGQRRAVFLPGRVVLDGIELLRASFYRFESFALDHVAGELLGEGKLIHGADRGEEITRLFESDREALAAYNLRDAELVSEIFSRERLLDFALARSGMTGLALDRMGGSVASFDNLYLPRLHRSGFVAPNPAASGTASPGGFVLDSRPGLYDFVLILDFRSLYPSIIRTFHIDPLGLVLATRGGLAEEDTVPGYLGARFARRGHILPGVIESLWHQRDRAREAGNAPLSQAIKIIMNSFYGVLGSTGCRFYDPRLASSITRRGHMILRQTRDVIEAAGHTVIYGDTDSVFVWVREAGDVKEARAVGEALQNRLNAYWRERLACEYGLESALELEFETLFRRFLMPTVRGSDRGSKKRYAGLVSTQEGERLLFKGLEYVRSDWTALAREFQEELYRRVFEQKPYEDWMRATVAAVRAGKCDAKLVYRKRLRRRLIEYRRNVPPHVQAARLFHDRGLAQPARGDWVEYVITRVGAEPAAAPSAPLDYQHYIERQLQPVADGILHLMNRSFNDIAEDQITMF